LESLQGSLNALLQGQVPVTFTGYFGTPHGPVPAPAPVPVPAPVPTSVGAAILAPSTPEPGLPVFAALAKAYTVKDVWKEWKEGLAGRPAVQELEEKWGSRWRPGNTVRVQFCRRKVIWDEILARIARGKSEEEVIAELELLRAGRSLNRLVDDLKHRRQYAQPRASEQRAIRGQGRARRWGRWGRRGCPSRQLAAV
jgi:hypothetical protein